MNKDLMIIIVDDELEALTHFLYQVVEEKNICYKFFNTNPLEAIDYVKKTCSRCSIFRYKNGYN